MTTKINTPVNNSIEAVLKALNVAREQAEKAHDWRTVEALGQVFEQVVDICPKTTESQIMAVDSFVKSLSRRDQVERDFNAGWDF